MSRANPFAMSALLIVSALATGPTISLAQTMPPMGQPDQDHSAHHPGAHAGKPLVTPPSGAMPMGMMTGNMKQMMSMMRGMMSMMSAESGMMTSHVEGRIASLKTELKVTEAQTPQWNRFADALRAAAKSMNGMYEQMMQPKDSATLPVRLEAQETMLSAHLTALKALKDALDPLYASFSDDQKKAADGLMIGPMGMM